MIELEDFHEDILSKAMRGLGIGKNEMAQRLSVDKSKIEGIFSGESDENIIKAMAGELEMDSEKILQSSRKEWSPAPVELSGLKQISSTYGDMIVNAYVIWDQITHKAWIFDTGTGSKPILAFIEEKKLTVDAIFLTHTHRDHIACLDDLRKETPYLKVYVHQLELFDRCEPIQEGFKYSMDSLSLVTKHTHGHSRGGMTYLACGLANPVAFVGDALFAGSIGGGMVSYADALKTNREKLMTLTDETIICPGHGPMSTIGEEKKYNPFFPEF